MCTSGCPTQSCESYAACLRGKGTKVSYCNSAGGFDYTKQKAWDRNLADYKDARAEGMQPQGTQPQQIDRARRISDATGLPYKANK